MKKPWRDMTGYTKGVKGVTVGEGCVDLEVLAKNRVPAGQDACRFRLFPRGPSSVVSDLNLRSRISLPPSIRPPDWSLPCPRLPNPSSKRYVPKGFHKRTHNS